MLVLHCLSPKWVQTWENFVGKMKNPACMKRKCSGFETNSSKSFVPPHLVRWKSLQLHAPTSSEIGIRHEGKSVMNVQFPQMSTVDNSDFRTKY
jgi:hypothetical protein